MPTVLAINIKEDEATVVTAAKTAAGPIQLLEARNVRLRPAEPAFDGVANSSENNNSVSIEELVQAVNEADSSLAVISTSRILYKKFQLPFNDQKKLDQVAPIQLQDSVPFDIDDFVIDNMVLDKSEDGQYSILASAVPEEDVVKALSFTARAGVDPKLLTTRASALAAFADAWAPLENRDFAVLELARDYAALAIFVNEKIAHVREFPDNSFFAGNNSIPNTPLLSAINSSLAAIEYEQGAKLSTVHVIGSDEAFRACAAALNLPVKKLDLESHIVDQTGENLALSDYSWAAGLLAAETKKCAVPLVDFRKGRFAHNPVWKSFVSALKEEFFPLALALLFAVGWYGSVVYNTHRSASIVEDRIAGLLKEAIPGEAVPARQEVSHLEQKVGALEEQLQGIGSLSSLSPLESLKRLSTLINASIDVEIESMSIGSGGINFNGSSLDKPTLGRLDAALKAAPFCEPNISPSGTVPGSSRVAFRAEVKLCE